MKLAVEILGVVPITDIPPQDRNKLAENRLWFFTNSAIHVPYGWALKIRHNLRAAQAVHERIKGCGNRVGVPLRVVVRQEIAYVSPATRAKQPARLYVEQLLLAVSDKGPFLASEDIQLELELRPEFGQVSILTVESILEAIKSDRRFEVREIWDGDVARYSAKRRRRRAVKQRTS